ncbi:MAG: type II secretion system protein [Candidatus Paceibacterota bacterium]|jgi:prepilin-type N-terminal cleavage/methylation domain-containing protein
MTIIQDQKGMTLIEVLLAIAVLCIGISGVMQVFPFAIEKGAMAKNRSTAAYLAQGRIEELLSFSYDDAYLGTGTTTTSTSPGYQVQTNIDYVDPNNGLAPTSTDLGIKKIKVKVSWGQIQSSQSLEVSTLYSKK